MILFGKFFIYGAKIPDDQAEITSKFEAFLLVNFLVQWIFKK
jgi:hypothetical protein